MTSDDFRNRMSNIEQKIEDIAEKVDHMHTLLVGDGEGLSIAAKVHLLWTSIIFLSTTVIGLIVERLFAFFGGRHS